MGECSIARRGLGLLIHKWEKRTIVQVPNIVQQPYIDKSKVTGVYDTYTFTTAPGNTPLSWVFHLWLDPAQITNTTVQHFHDCGNQIGSFVAYKGRWYRVSGYDINSIISFDGVTDLQYRQVQNGTKDGPGEWICDVYASELSCYPAGGAQSGYWYVKRR